MKYLPIITLPLAAFFLWVAISTVQSHKASSEEVRPPEDMCYELALELQKVAADGLITDSQATAITERCYRDFVPVDR